MSMPVHYAMNHVPRSLPSDQPYRLLGPALVMGGLTGSAVWAGTLAAEWLIASHTGLLGGVSHMGLGGHARYMLETLAHRLMHRHPFASDVAAYQAALDQMNYMLIKGKMLLALLPGVAAAAAMFKKMAILHCDTRHLSGMQYHAGKDALEKAKLAVEAMNGEGVEGQLTVHPDLPGASEQVISKSVMVTGSAGAGKTAMLNWMFRSAMEGRHFLLVVDIKGDLSWVFQKMNKMLGRRSREIAVIGMFNDEDAAWDIGNDLMSDQDAVAFAVAQIPESKDPMWSNGARGVLRVVVLSLIHEYRQARREARARGLPRPAAWHWGHLAQRVQAPMTQIYAWALKYDPMVAAIIEDHARSATIKSFEITMRNFAQPIVAQGQAWGDELPGKPKRRRVSLLRYVKGMDQPDYNGVRTIVLRNHQRYSDMAQGYIRAMHAFVTDAVLSLGSGQAGQAARNMIVFLDEFPALGKVESIYKALEMGRSYGLKHIIAAQTESALIELYGEHGLKRIQGNTSLKIYGLASDPVQAAAIANSFPKRRVQRLIRGTAAKKGQPAVEDRYDEGEAVVLTGDVLSSSRKMGPQGRKGVRAIIRLGDDLFHLTWPYAPAELVPRAPKDLDMKVASWLTGGKVPPLSDYTPKAGWPEITETQAAPDVPADVPVPAGDPEGLMNLLDDSDPAGVETPDGEHEHSRETPLPVAVEPDRPITARERVAALRRPMVTIQETVEVDVERDSVEYHHATLDAANLQREQERRGDWHDPGEIDESTSLLAEAAAGPVLEALIPGGHALMEMLKLAEGAQAPAKNVENVIDSQTGEIRTVTVEAPKKLVTTQRQVPVRRPENEQERPM
ncbi:Type IV secretion-system coupling protein DNA-binding domain-containing protein [Paraburkholderia phenazinium]|uniref:Type IV secretion-system coupling protein DNA-binding domain-containing protein n=1 Tax=Paraburkholderia phenazinium TaxID=60549 RepID=A0A1G7Y7T7_9BURK|nr:type IV secretion system DNA-binding domain-containing protein [Paraburkholderia phenazinium]SDG92417.1 Type IV secretion-system coupling protein DNA-binding domain-containing protein [Paraburkholderia phenazinium]